MTVYLIDGYNVLYQLLGYHGREDRSTRSRQIKRSAIRDSRPRLSQHQPEARQGSPFGYGAPDLEDERQHLVDRIASYMGGTSDRALIVFDSHSEMLQKVESATANVEVYFGSFSRSADAIIEREVYALSAGENVVVVSSDYQLQKTIFLPNVTRRSSRQFVADLQDHTKSIANSKNCTTMSHRIEERVDPGTIERLKALRDRLASRPEEPSGEE